MCRNIKPLFNFEPPTTEDEVRAAAVQFNPCRVRRHAITLLETAPYHKPYQVIVTFVAPVIAEADVSVDRDCFWSSFGAWADEPTTSVPTALRPAAS